MIRVTTMTLPTVWPLLLLVLTIPQPSAVLCGECEDCNTLVAGLKAVALSQESIVTQQDIIKNTVRDEIICKNLKENISTTVYRSALTLAWDPLTTIPTVKSN